MHLSLVIDRQRGTERPRQPLISEVRVYRELSKSVELSGQAIHTPIGLLFFARIDSHKMPLCVSES